MLMLALVGTFLLATNHAASSKEKVESPSAWTIRCTEIPKDAEKKDSKAVKSCEIFQRLSVKETGQRLIEFAVGKNVDSETGDARGVVVLPLGILLQPGVLMQIDKDQPYKFDVNHCTEKGCFAYVDLNAEIIDHMYKGNLATLILKTIEGKNVKIALSLKGFKQSYEKVSK